MRVIAGEFGGRPLLAPRGWKVRPTSDRVREATFSALGDVEGLTIADLFCGTGALGIEAISRGANRATFVDRDVRAVVGNIEALGIRERCELVRSDVGSYIKGFATQDGRLLADDPPAPGGRRFDLVFCDPPYKLADRLGPQLDKHLPSLLAEGGRVIVESAASRPMKINSLDRVRQRRYGGTEVSIYLERDGGSV